MLVFSDVARAAIQSALSAETGEALALRICLADAGVGEGYDLVVVPGWDREPSDVSFDAGGFEVRVDAAAAPRLAGASIDYVEREGEAGFEVRGAAAAPHSSEAATGSLENRVRQALRDMVNPGVAAHGGEIVLEELRQGVAYLTMRGGCQGCGLARLTLHEGVEQILRLAVPELEGVVDVTDHAAGARPYYPRNH